MRQEEEPGLGNGGLGRLAACYLDSLATLRIPALGYGIRYSFGIFDQEIRDGWQVEITDKWLRLGNPWEIRRSEIAFEVGEGGHTERYHDAAGRLRVRWRPANVIKGVAYDTPVAGYRSGVTNILRLWRSEAVESFDFQAFNVGDYERAVEDKITSETVSKVLYPNDQPEIGKRLRLLQQYFFVSCSLQDALRIHLLRGCKLTDLAEGFALQLNDTHPSVAVAELMRLLVDEHLLDWDDAWRITCATLAYTNHTLLPEALERWPLEMFGGMLPRHLEIILEINRRFLDDVRAKRPGDQEFVSRVSLIDESGSRHVRMANLAAVGSHAVNGVAALHTDLLKQTVMRDFHELFPERFLNVTNGVTPRRWIALCNPDLARLITEAIGDGWLSDAEHRLDALAAFAEDAAFQAKWRAVKRGNKVRLAGVLRERTGVVVDPDSIFDVQVKRLHEYKRQHLNALHIVALYDAIKRDPAREVRPAHLHLRRQGGARLRRRQAHHQAHQRDRRGRERRRRRRRPAQGGVLPRLQRDQRAADLPRGRRLRADLDRGQGGVGHGEHEVRDERRPHGGHARRRERRDPRRGGGGELLPVRPHGGRGRSRPGPRATSRAAATRRTRGCAQPSIRSPAAPSRVATAACSGRW